jgi:hypothetical protein
MIVKPHYEPIKLNEWLGLFDSNTTKRPYYTVLGKKFYNKFLAIQESKQIIKTTGLNPWYVLRWHCFDELMSYDFSVESPESYRELCKQRAKQLREKYDYIRLWYSAGPDSHTALRAFHEANVTIDELVLIVNYTNGEDEPSAVEGTKLGIPTLNKIKNWFPNCKITVLDWALDTNIKQENEETQISRVIKSHLGVPLTKTMAHGFELDKKLLNQYVTDKKICELTGEPKPSVIKKNNKWYSYLIDISIETSMLIPNLEMFHLSSDFPQLYAKQCHMLKRQFKKLMIDKEENFSMTLNKNQDQKNIFLERYNEWDESNIIEYVHQFTKNTSKTGEEKLVAWQINLQKNNSELNNFQQWYSNFYHNEVYKDAEDFYNKGKYFRISKGMLSNFWCLDEPINKTVDELFPLGFGVYK